MICNGGIGYFVSSIYEGIGSYPQILKSQSFDPPRAWVILAT